MSINYTQYVIVVHPKRIPEVEEIIQAWSLRVVDRRWINGAGKGTKLAAVAPKAPYKKRVYLSDDQLIDIRTNYKDVTLPKIAEKFGCSKTTAGRILQGLHPRLKKLGILKKSRTKK